MVMVLAQSISDPNFPGILTGLEKVANARGYGVLIGNTEGDVALEEKYLRFLSTGMADGLILLSGHVPVAGWPKNPSMALPPMVAVSKPVRHENVAYVGIDDVNGSKVATEYLMSLGHKRIAYVSGPHGDAVSDLRYRGYCMALGEALDPDLIWQVQGDGTSEGGRAAVERLFIRDTLPTAFFCYNDNSAIGVIGSLQTRGYQVPRDFSVVGFDDIPFARNISPSLTTIRQPRGQIGELAMTHLLDLLKTRNISGNETLLHGDLIVRDSCAAPGRK